MSNDAAVLKKGSGTVMVFGVTMIVLGFLTIGSPVVAGGAIAVFVGVLVLLGGALEFVAAMNGAVAGSRGLAFLSSVFALVFGVFLVTKPLQALIALTLLLAIYFVMDGVARIVLAFHARPRRGWGFVLVGGVITLLLGLMIWRQWPLSGVWAIGLLVGVRMIVAGSSMLALGSAVRAAAGMETRAAAV